MFEFLMGFDVLGVGALLGALLLLGGLIWILVQNRPLEDLNRRYAESQNVPADVAESAMSRPAAAPAGTESDTGPHRPAGGRRAA